MVEMDHMNGHGSPEIVPYEAGTQQQGSLFTVSSQPPFTTVMESLTRQVGKRISVVSRADYRYEGVLQEIDVNAATASLGRVRFWGTESRQPVNGTASRQESYDKVKFRLSELKDIFAHVEQCNDMLSDPTVVECSMAVVPILWSTPSEEASSEAFVLPDGRRNDDIGEMLTADEWNSVLVDKDAAVKLLSGYLGTRNRISIISKSLIRYEGILKLLDEATTQVSLVCVRFFGTEDRPAVKKAEARYETYPSVKFQLGEARDIKAYVKMCEEMAGDNAVIVSESSHGFVCAPRKRLPPPPTSSPSKTEPRSSTQFDVANINGSLQLRMPEMSSSPRKDGSRILLNVPNAAGTSRAPSGQVTDHSGDSQGDQQNSRSPRTTHHFTSSGRLSRQVETNSGSVSGGASSPGLDVDGQPKKRRGRKPGSKFPRSPDAASPVKRKRMKKTSATGSVKRGKGAGKQRSSSLHGGLGGGVGGAGGVGQEDDSAGAADQMEHSSEGNGGTSPAAHSSGRNGGSSNQGIVQFLLPWNDLSKKFPCPLDDCIEDYEGASNVHHMYQHFMRAHKDTHPQVQFSLQCHICEATGFDQKLPTLKQHIEKVHGTQQEVEGHTAADQIPFNREEEVQEGARDDGAL